MNTRIKGQRTLFIQFNQWIALRLIFSNYYRLFTLKWPSPLISNLYTSEYFSVQTNGNNFLFQFPTITVCPSSGIAKESWSFARNYLDRLERNDRDNKALFSFIPRRIFELAKEKNMITFR